MQPDEILTQLATMTRHLGDPALDYTILGEGNTSDSEFSRPNLLLRDRMV
jgi:hypothetical protein